MPGVARTAFQAVAAFQAVLVRGVKADAAACIAVAAWRSEADKMLALGTELSPVRM
jgi:hypothetical protein